MPCYDPETHERPERLEKKVQKLTRILCSLCTELERTNPTVLKRNKDLIAWWKAHKAHDLRVKEITAKREKYGPDALTQEERNFSWDMNDISF